MPIANLGPRYKRGRVGFAAIAVTTLIAGLLGSGAAAAPPQPGGRQLGLVVATAGGVVEGTRKGKTDEFLGIPYAAPPVGRLRWRAPRPPAPWKGIRDATHFAPHCPQPASYFGVASTDENCLYLNVYAPAHDRGRKRALPVMVWIHGGAFVWGESNDYNPSGLVRRGIIVVTINYRLGALGFLADSTLARRPGKPSGNYGLMDQQAALRWVHHNIAKFGGDARRVTIAGESSGGLSVLAQLASPGARGLFSGAIAESGAYDLEPESLATAESAGETFAAKAGCAPQSAACLRALPVRTVLADESPIGYRPDIDGRVLTQSLTAAFTTGHFNRVPVIDGSNQDEYRLFVAIYQLDGEPTTPADYQSLIAAILGVSTPVAAAIAGKYPLAAYPSPPLALGAVGTDAMFACPALTADESLSSYVPIYAYEFNDDNAPERYLPPVGFPYGAAHESEVQYLFRLAHTADPAALTAPQHELAAAMKQDWANFVKRGSPSAGTQAWWPTFHQISQQMLSLVAPRPRVETDFAAEHHCSFWNRARSGIRPAP